MAVRTSIATSRQFCAVPSRAINTYNVTNLVSWRCSIIVFLPDQAVFAMMPNSNLEGQTLLINGSGTFKTRQIETTKYKIRSTLTLPIDVGVGDGLSTGSVFLKETWDVDPSRAPFSRNILHVMSFSFGCLTEVHETGDYTCKDNGYANNNNNTVLPVGRCIALMSVRLDS